MDNNNNNHKTFSKKNYIFTHSLAKITTTSEKSTTAWKIRVRISTGFANK